MDKMVSFDAILFPADERAPHLVPLMTSNASSVPPLGQSGSRPPPHPMAKVPHPEMYMDFVAEVSGGRAWEHHVIEKLDGMGKKFESPYIIFYPVLSRDGMPFPINKCVREIQGLNYCENVAWRGNLVVAKYSDERLSALVDANMADFPLVKNYLSMHYSPAVSPLPPCLRTHPHIVTHQMQVMTTSPMS